MTAKAQRIPGADHPITIEPNASRVVVSVATYCPYKGDCAYYSIPVGGERSTNAVWAYEEPLAAVQMLKGHLAFHPDRVDSIEERRE